MDIAMQISKLAAAAALAALAMTSAQAEEYDGVHALTHERSRAEVQAEARIAARAGNPYSDAAAEGVLEFDSALDRATVHAQGVARAHDRYHALDRWQFYRDTIPQEFYKPKMTFGRQPAHQAGQ
jgi:hypothetical protein